MYPLMPGMPGLPLAFGAAPRPLDEDEEESFGVRPRKKAPPASRTSDGPPVPGEPRTPARATIADARETPQYPPYEPAPFPSFDEYSRGRNYPAQAPHQGFRSETYLPMMGDPYPDNPLSPWKDPDHPLAGQAMATQAQQHSALLNALNRDDPGVAAAMAMNANAQQRHLDRPMEEYAKAAEADVKRQALAASGPNELARQALANKGQLDVETQRGLRETEAMQNAGVQAYVNQQIANKEPVDPKVIERLQRAKDLGRELGKAGRRGDDATRGKAREELARLASEQSQELTKEERAAIKAHVTGKTFNLDELVKSLANNPRSGKDAAFMNEIERDLLGRQTGSLQDTIDEAVKNLMYYGSSASPDTGGRTAGGTYGGVEYSTEDKTPFTAHATMTTPEGHTQWRVRPGPGAIGIGALMGYNKWLPNFGRSADADDLARAHVAGDLLRRLLKAKHSGPPLPEMPQGTPISMLSGPQQDRLLGGPSAGRFPAASRTSDGPPLPYHA